MVRLTRVHAALALVVMFGIQEQLHAAWVWTPQTGRWVNPKRLPKETPELQVEHARSLLVQGQYQQALHETEKFADFYAESDLADDNQFLRGEIKQAQEDYLDSAKEFQQVVTSYPESPLFDQVIEKQYEIGDKLYDDGQAKLKKKWRLFRKRPLKRAIEVYGMVISNQPFTTAAAEAQYKVGLCHFTRGEYIEAAYEYRRVIDDYSTSDWVDEASYDLAMTYYKSSHPAEYDQAPSQLAIDAVDEFKARYPADNRVGDLDEKRKEMRETMARQRLLIARFYGKRREFAAARIYYEVLSSQFSETTAAEEARTWLDQNPGAGKKNPQTSTETPTQPS